MFTGIIEDVGTLAEFRRGGTGATVVVSTRLGSQGEVALGDSIAVDGCCLTVTRFGDGRFEADLSAETLARTTLGSLAAGSRVNLERALAAGSRMGGHIVQGHVDSVGSIASSTVAKGVVFTSFVTASGAPRTWRGYPPRD